MPWSEIFNRKIYEYFLIGEDEVERQNLYKSLIALYTQAKYKCLQVGVHSTKNEKHGNNWVSIDLYDARPCIDLKMDLHKLEFENDFFDFIEACAILEHCKKPWICAEEINRVLKSGGYCYLEVPFCQVYHPTSAQGSQNNGGDYYRWTQQGIAEMMKPLVCEKTLLGNDGGIVYLGRKK